MSASNAPSTSPSLKGGQLYRIDREIDLALPPADVFDFITTPSLRPLWFPLSVRIVNTPERPLLFGECAYETLRLGWRRLDVEWSVVTYEPGQVWSISTDTALGEAPLPYRPGRSSAGCRFVHTLSYRSRRIPWRWLDDSFVRWRLSRICEQALSQLKAILQGHAPAL